MQEFLFQWSAWSSVLQNTQQGGGAEGSDNEEDEGRWVWVKRGWADKRKEKTESEKNEWCREKVEKKGENSMNENKLVFSERSQF